MTAHRALFYYLWFAPHVLLLVMAGVMVRKKLIREFPAFFAYTVNEIVQFAVLYTLYKMPSVTGMQYTWVWLGLNALSVCFRFAIIHEVFQHLFQSYSALKDAGSLLFRWSTAALMIVAVVLVASVSGSPTDRLTLAYTVVDRVVSMVQCGLLVLVLVLARFFSLPLRSRTAGITLGLGLFASAELGILAIRAQWGLDVASEFLNRLTLAVYHCCVLIWIVALLVPEAEADRVLAVPAHNLDHWNDELQRLLQQ